MEKYDILTKRLNRLDLSFDNEGFTFKTYWMRYHNSGAEKAKWKVHFHSFTEIHFVLNGTYIMDVDGKRFELRNGQYVIFYKGERHTIVYESADLKKLVWGVDISSDDKEKDSLLHIADTLRTRRVFEINAESDALIKCIFLEIKQPSYACKPALIALLYCLFLNMLRCFLDTKPISAQLDDNNVEKRVERIKAFIKDNIYSSITISDLSHEFYLCDRQINRLFQKHYAMSVSRYIKLAKIDEAKKLLRNTDMQINELALSLNFNSDTSFIRTFKQMEGQTPLVYRRSLRGI